MNHHAPDLFRRHPSNPLLTAATWPYPANSVFNPGATQLPTGEVLLMVRVEDRRGISHLTAARSDDGIHNWRIDAQPTFAAQSDHYPEELWGVEDARIVLLEELGLYAMTYTAYSRSGPLVALAMTEDFKTFERHGSIMPPEDKDAAFFPRRFGGRWALIHRPVPRLTEAKANMWLSYSPDLTHWGDHTVLIEARDGAWWDAGKVGLSSQPIETEEGWLIVYHGVRHTAAGALYRVGLALLDLDDPRRVLRRGDEWVINARTPYEIDGDVANVVFPCGAVLDQASGELRLYYGAADSCVGLITARLSDLLDWLRTQPEPAAAHAIA
ncbi:MAG: glycosidase related protein [Chloroflexi bacterium]|nr:glycosidase related protein [Chloroflexota bacterium]